MKCLTLFCVLLTIKFLTVHAEFKIKKEIQELAEQVEIMKTLHVTDVMRMKREIEELKELTTLHSSGNHERNEKMALQWAKTSMNELRLEMKEIGRSINNSALLRQLHSIRNELKQALMETSDLAKLARTQEARVDKLDGEVGRLRYEGQQMRAMIAEVRGHVAKITKEMKTKQLADLNPDYNDVLEPHEQRAGELKPEHNHKYRHNKMVHAQISRLAKSQDQLDEFQQSLQTQILDVQRRMDRFEEPNWNLLSAKVEFLELETKVLGEELKNTSQKISDLDKVHTSMLELREDVENIENKADKIIPEFRKEISKLDISFAQLNAQSSYLKEDQENLRQSVKAIAVSVSNTIDRAELDRLTMKKINESIADLETRSKQHFYRLNDHILKSEANNVDGNHTDIMPLPELIDEVKELQPVQREYEDLVNQLPEDCSSISGPNGVYMIHPGNGPMDTWCSNGSTLLQRRHNGTLEFNRKFGEYVRGFGTPAGEYWVGLETMHQLTARNCSSMRLDMTDIYGGYWYAQYDQFYVGGADSGFILELSGFKGNASDAFEYQNHMEFSAIDRDRDVSNTHCAGNYEGGWWFSHCQHVNINGKYTLGLTWFDSARNEWIAVATSEMRMYRRPGCS
ncbi:protein scabrous [Plodia interpunctella]|uniref:protein scabrous n=1 Tax=Plodia interpunctella TaxID=58824 RepID=UPI002368AB6F|nr:protein scabrous [Plodia interpunctella]